MLHGAFPFYGRRQVELNQHNSITVTYSPLRNRSTNHLRTQPSRGKENESFEVAPRSKKQFCPSNQTYDYGSFHREKWKVNGANNNNNNVSKCDSIL